MMPKSEPNGPDLSRLNKAERQVLRLLGEGHTAKSVANELGSTPASVNERLREARRKTGIGSSRELARLLRSRENRDDGMGMASEQANGSSETPEPPPSARQGWSRKGVMMISVTVAAMVAIAIQAPQGKDAVKPLIGEPLQEFPQPAELHRKVRAEARDAEWAGRTEAAVTKRVSKIPLIGENGNLLRVTCGSSLCEVAGTMIDPSSLAEIENPNSPHSRAIRDLQAAPLADDLAKLGLKSESGSFQAGKGGPKRSVFLIYYSRVR